MPSKTKILLGFAALLLLLLSVGEGPLLLHAFAQSAGAETPAGTSVTKVMAEIFTGAITILNFLGVMFLQLLSYLLNPDFIFGVGGSSKGATGEQVLLNVWQFSRDVMNLIFAILLIVGAMVTVVLGKREVIAPYVIKFLLAVVLVNFSWFFPRVVFDISNVATATIYGLPQTIGGFKCEWRDDKGVVQPCTVITHVEYFPDKETFKCPDGREPTLKPDNGIMAVCTAELSEENNTSFGILNSLVLNHGSLVRIGQIPGCPPGGCGKAGTAAETIRFLITSVVVLFAHLLLIFPIIAMGVAFFVRIPILWLTIAFMPFMFLGFLIEGKFIKYNTMEKIWNKFIAVVFMPAAVAVPLMLGTVMLSAAAKWQPADAMGQQLIGAKFPLIAGVPNLWALMWLLMSFGVLWVGAFTALKMDETIGKFVAPIEQMGKSWAKLPLNIPLPIGFGPLSDSKGKPTLQSAGDLFGYAKHPEILARKTAEKIWGQAELPGPIGQGSVNMPKVQGVVQTPGAKRDNIKAIIEKGALGNIKGAIEEFKKAAQDLEVNFNARTLQVIADEMQKGGHITPDQFRDFVLELKKAFDTDVADIKKQG